MWQHLHRLVGLPFVARFPKHAPEPSQQKRRTRQRGDKPFIVHAVEHLEPRVLLNGHPTVLSIDINDGQDQRSMVTSVAVRFSSDVSQSLDGVDLLVQNVDTNTAVEPFAIAVDYDQARQTATFTFPGLGSTGNSLANGNYVATLLASGISDGTGQPLDGNGDGNGGDNFSFRFFRLFGDVDGDRHVGPLDLQSLRDAWDSSSPDPRYNPALDSDSDGDVGVLDLLAFRETFDTSLEIPMTIFEFGSSGNDDNEFDTPTDLAIFNDTLYVVDSENNRIKIFELTRGDNCPSGTDEIVNDHVCFDEDFGSTGSSDGRFDVPTDLAISRDNGDVYVVDSDNNRVQRFQADGDFDNLEFGSSDNSDDEYLGTPSAIAIDRRSDYIYVADSTTDSISAFDDDGNFLFIFGDTGSDEDEFRNPSGMVIDNSRDILYVADTDNNRIQMFELTDGDNCPSGTDEFVNDEVCFIDSFGSSGSDEGEFDEPSGLAFDESENHLYVADTENNRIQVFEIVSGNTCPSGTDEVIDGVCFVREFGSAGSGVGEFNNPSGLAFDPDSGSLYVADTGNHRVQVFSAHFDVPPPNVPDNAPVNLSAFPASPTSIVITWDAPELVTGVGQITGYKIEAKAGDEPFAAIVDNTKTTLTSFTHTGLVEGQTYRYRVSAITPEQTSPTSSTASARPQATHAPAGLHAFPISRSQILLSWQPPSDTFNQAITGYVIEREIISGVLYDRVTEVNGSTTSFTVNSLETGKTFSYVVSAKLGIGNTPRSNTASATPDENSKPPTSPTLVFGLEKPLYRNDERMTFVGREPTGRKSVFVLVRDSLGRFTGMVSDPASDPNGSFRTISRSVSTLFRQPGNYTATAFTSDQKERDGVVLQLTYDGEKVFETSTNRELVASDTRPHRRKLVLGRHHSIQRNLIGMTDRGHLHNPLKKALWKAKLRESVFRTS